MMKMVDGVLDYGETMLYPSPSTYIRKCGKGVTVYLFRITGVYTIVNEGQIEHLVETDKWRYRILHDNEVWMELKDLYLRGPFSPGGERILWERQ